MFSEPTKCPLTRHEVTTREDASVRQVRVSCPACGEFDITSNAWTLLSREDGPARGKEHILAASARGASDSGNPLLLTTEKITQLLSSTGALESPERILDDVLIYLAKRAGFAFFAPVEIRPDRDYPLFSTQDGRDLELLLRGAEKRGLITKQSHIHFLTLDGWQRVSAIRAGLPKSNQAFVAMWLAPTMDAIWNQGFKPALEGVGYRPMRIDREQFNDKIDDHIVAEIRRSGLLVADVTGHRQGVYFEGGFAMGLGIPVIWTCRKEEFEKTHFDTNHYNHILWEGVDDLKRQLVDRIEATLPAREKRISPGQGA